MARSALLFLAALLFYSVDAGAATVTVEYELTGGTILFTFQCPCPPAPITGGTMTVRFQGIGINTISSGPATLLSFDAVGGTTNRVQVAGLPAPGTHTATGSGPAGFQGVGTILSGPSLTYSVTFGTFGQANLQLYAALLTGSLSGFALITPSTEDYLQVDFTMQEVSRTFDAPEPHRGLVSAVAIAAGLALFLLRRHGSCCDLEDGEGVS